LRAQQNSDAFIDAVFRTAQRHPVFGTAPNDDNLNHVGMIGSSTFDLADKNSPMTEPTQSPDWACATCASGPRLKPLKC
jgi:hypothetical protein